MAVFCWFICFIYPLIKARTFENMGVLCKSMGSHEFGATCCYRTFFLLDHLFFRGPLAPALFLLYFIGYCMIH